MSPKINLIYHQNYSYTDRVEKVFSEAKHIVEQPLRLPYRTKQALYSPKDVKVVQFNVQERSFETGVNYEPHRLHSKKKEYSNEVKYMTYGSKEK